MDDRQRFIYPAALVSYYAGTAMGAEHKFEKILDMFIPSRRDADDAPADDFASILKVFKEA